MLISSISHQTERRCLKYKTKKLLFRLALGISTNVLTTQQTQVLQITNISTEHDVDIVYLYLVKETNTVEAQPGRRFVPSGDKEEKVAIQMNASCC
jgi:hypothetical protein